MRLDRLAMLHQRVRGAVELHRADGLEVDVEQLAEAAARLQSGASRAPRRAGETPDNVAGRRRAQGALTPPAAGRPNCSSAPALRRCGAQTQRVDIDPLHCRSGRRGPVRRERQLRGDALGFVLDGGRAIGDQGRLAGQVVDASAQRSAIGPGGCRSGARNSRCFRMPGVRVFRPGSAWVIAHDSQPIHGNHASLTVEIPKYPKIFKLGLVVPLFPHGNPQACKIVFWTDPDRRLVGPVAVRGCFPPTRPGVALLIAFGYGGPIGRP